MYVLENVVKVGVVAGWVWGILCHFNIVFHF
jgi:hypothetical protein